MTTIFIKGTLVIALAMLAHLALRRAPATIRHGAWTATMAALLLLFVAPMLAPAWEVEIPGLSLAGPDPAATSMPDSSTLQADTGSLSTSKPTATLAVDDDRQASSPTGATSPRSLFLVAGSISRRADAGVPALAPRCDYLPCQYSDGDGLHPAKDPSPRRSSRLGYGTDPTSRAPRAGSLPAAGSPHIHHGLDLVRSSLAESAGLDRASQVH